MSTLISCVSENSPQWFTKTENLALSVRRLGGRMRAAPMIVNFVGSVAPEYERRLGDLDVETRVVERVKGEHAFANKLRMLDLHEDRDFDVLVALDCDVVVVDDISGNVPRARIGAKPADYDYLTEPEWLRLNHALGLTPAPRALIATSSGERIRPYFNSGVLTVPRALCAALEHHWIAIHADLRRVLAGQPRLLPRHVQLHVDQLALALAISAAELPYAGLPLSMNFPTHVPVRRSVVREDGSSQPMVLHYHGEIDPLGFLRRPLSEAAVSPADRFNRARAEALSLAYCGLSRRSVRSRLHRLLLRRVRNRSRARLRKLIAARPLGPLPGGSE